MVSDTGGKWKMIVSGMPGSFLSPKNFILWGGDRMRGNHFCSFTGKNNLCASFSAWDFMNWVPSTFGLPFI